jgi:hypothetical protein
MDAYALIARVPTFAPPVLCAGSEIPRPAASDSVSIRHPLPQPSTPPTTASIGTTTSLPCVGQL